MSDEQNQDKDQRQDIAVVGSPSTNTELTIDLLQEATEERLVGALTAFRATQDGKAIMSIGQIIGIELRNRWHEDSVFRNLVKRTGEIPPITNRQDTRTANLVIGATFRRENDSQGIFQPDVLGMVPPTGTMIYRVDQSLLSQILQSYQSEVFYLGRAYANEVNYPMWFKHFGSGSEGAGEAYHLGVFGKTGSGKSGLAKMMLCAYARHPDMGILVIDPQGEFSLELSGTSVGQQNLGLKEIIHGQGKEIHVYGISDLQLDDWMTFEEMLISLSFFDQLGIPKASVDNRRLAAEFIRNSLEKSRHRLDNLSTLEILQNALEAINDANEKRLIYRTPTRSQQLQQRVGELLQDQSALNALFEKSWKPICQLFSKGEQRKRLFSYSSGSPGIIDMLLESDNGSNSKPIVVIDISKEGNQDFWSEEIQKCILSKLLNILVSQATTKLSTKKSANVLVLLDEAHRHASSGRLDEDTEASRLRLLLRRAVRETRKYGIGWFFISPTLGGLDNEILQQLRVLTFGFGLAMGTEFDRLRDFVGGDKRALELYQSFRDPQSFPSQDLHEFPFMAVGPISPLAFSGKPLFFTAFTDPEEFLKANELD